MFTARPDIDFARPLPGITPPAGTTSGQACRAGGILRLAALSGLLALALPGTSSAQALGTMQVSARVVSASVAWTALAEAGVAARSAAEQQPAGTLVRRGRLVHATAQIHPSSGHPGGPRLLVVTIQHPHN
jgi:hypothetical protein